MTQNAMTPDLQADGKFTQSGDQPAPRVPVKEMPLLNEPVTDRRYCAEDGTIDLRWRLTRTGDNEAETLGETAPNIYFYKLTAVLLVSEADGPRVWLNSCGKPEIIAEHDFTLGVENLANMQPGEIEAFILKVIEEQTFVATKAHAMLREKEAVLSSWGGGVIPEQQNP